MVSFARTAVVARACRAQASISVGTVVTVRSVGAGGVTVAEGSGVTVNGDKTISQHESIALVKVATDEWDAIGGTAA
jgi:hypothetical protein